MSRGKTLGECLTSLRKELRVSLQASHNVQVRDTQIKHLQETQEWLWENYSWPHLRAERYLTPQIGQRFYDPAGCKKIDQSTGLLVAAGDVKIDRIDYLMLRDGDIWRAPLSPGITADEYNQWDSDAGDQSWPIERWQIAENDNVEVWPVPAEDGNETTLANMLKFVGTRSLTAFNDDDDTCDLDHLAIVYFAAAGMATPEEAKKHLAKAQQRIRDIRANANPRNRVKLFSKPAPRFILRGPPRVFYRTT